MRGSRLFWSASVVTAFAGASCGDATTKNDGGADVTTTDQLVADTSTNDASGPCNLGAPFGTPTLVPGVNVGQSIFGATFSSDELTAYLGTADSDLDAGGFQLYVATRPSLTAAFAAPTLLTGSVNNGANDERWPFVNAAGLKLFLSDNFQTYAATRANVQGTFGSPSSVAGVNATGFYTQNAYANADGSHLFVTSNRDTGSQSGWLYEATLVDGGYETPTKIAELASPQFEGEPVSSGDALTLYFASGRDGTGSHVFVATRSSLTTPFAMITEVTEVNSTDEGLDFPAWLSTDSCRLYVLSTRGTGLLEVYVAAKPEN